MARKNILTRNLRKQADTLFHGNMHAEAATVYAKICAADRTDTDARIMLAITKISTGAFGEAEEHCIRALKIDPDHALGHHALGTAYQRQGKLHEAIAEFIRATELRPDFANAHLFLANTLTELGDFNKAECSYQEALRQAPDLPDALAGLGRLYMQTGHLQEAETLIRKALQFDPGNTEHMIAVGDLLCSQGKPGDALPVLQQALLKEPDSYRANFSMGTVFKTLGNYDSAIRHYQKTLEIMPGDEFATGAVAGILERRGEFSAARELLQPFVDAGSRSAGITFPFADLAGHFGHQTEAVRALEQVLTDPTLDRATRIDIYYKIGKLLDAAGEYDQAFSHYRMANNLVQETNAHLTDINLVEVEAERILHSLESCESNYWTNITTTGSLSELPVFVVGMPRSGTTLVEQILASHPDIHGAGELGGIETIAGSICGNSSDYPACLKDVPDHAFHREATRHLKQLENFTGTAARVVDKNPHNFLHLGLITRLFPKARIIHISRDARDTCLSIYFQVFAPRHGYSSDLTRMGEHYKIYEQLMQYWNSKLENPILNIRYEQLVSDPEKTVRALIEFCGLPWNDGCLSFHATERDVNTPSYDQVRKPMYVKSIGRWKNYAGHLDTLFRSLSTDTAVDARMQD